MSDMRHLMKLVEVYSRDNKYLLDYMRDEEFDPYAHWYEVCHWLEKHDYLDDIAHLLPNIEINSATDLEEEDAELFYKLPEPIQKKCARDVIEYVMHHDPTEAPTWSHMTLTNKNKMLNRATWLVHFTDSPDAIATKGFTIGIDQMDKLGLTTWTKNDSFSKKQGGYNFAFEANSHYADHAARNHRYGKHAVLFQNAGVKAYHHGDDEDQVVFWGKDVDPRNIIVLYHNSDGDWVVQGSKRIKSGTTGRIYSQNVELFKGDFDKCIAWVQQNYRQYQRFLTRR